MSSATFRLRKPGRIFVAHGVAAAFAAVACCFSAPAAGQAKNEAYPSRPIRFVIGGGPDTLARLVGHKLTEAWGQQIVVDQRGGGAAAVSADFVAAAKPDGYTLLLATSTHATHMVMPGQKGQHYDLIRDFAPVTLAASTAFILCVHPSLPVRSVNELIRLAHARPGQLNYASGGSGSPPHLTMELFKSMTASDVVHVPYKTIAAGVTDLIAGQLQLMFTVAPSGLPHIATGRLRALAVSSGKRSPFIPSLPTVAESGVPGFDIYTWNGVLAPASTPPAIVAKLQSGIVSALQAADVVERVKSAGFEPLGTTQDEFGTFLRSEVDRWRKVVRQSRITGE